MTEQKLTELLRHAYHWGRDNGSNRSEKNFNDFLQTKAVKQALEPLLWKDILDEFYIKHDKQISNGEYTGKMLLVFRDWLEKNFEVPKRKLTHFGYDYKPTK
jgi:hypothetical protein